MSKPAERELAYYEDLYGGFAQQHFARPAVVAFRRYLAARILSVTSAGHSSRILSLGCGIGDTELLLAPHVAEVSGVDLSPKAAAQARADASRAGIRNVKFLSGDWREALNENDRYDLVLGIFFFHHLTDTELAAAPKQLAQVLRPGGAVYALEPSAHRLAGFIGERLVPHLMKKYQTADERQLVARTTSALFENVGYGVKANWFDFFSTPLAGLLPSWKTGYYLVRALDDAAVTIPLLRRLSANFELLAWLR
jgi:SAM-dependent methyltransferase